jgi:hypothetical protein
MFEDDQFRDEPRNEWVQNPEDYEYYQHIHVSLKFISMEFFFDFL